MHLGQDIGLNAGSECRGVRSTVVKLTEEELSNMASEGSRVVCTSGRFRVVGLVRQGDNGIGRAGGGVRSTAITTFKALSKTASEGSWIIELVCSGLTEVRIPWLLQWPLHAGRQLTHCLPDLTQEHALQRPLPLHRQHTGITYLHTPDILVSRSRRFSIKKTF